MGARLGSLVVDCADPAAVSAFWCQVLDWSIVDVDESDGAIEIGPADGSHPTMLFQPVAEPKQRKNRLHLDLHPIGGDQQSELERLLALGAAHVDLGQGDTSWIVLADPEGNEFCLLRTPSPS